VGQARSFELTADSAEGHLQCFRQGADFKPFIGATPPFFNDIDASSRPWPDEAGYLTVANAAGCSG
jgi:hypothetical protein